MRLKVILAIASAAAALSAVTSASAFDRPDRRDRPYSQAYADYLDDRYAYRYRPNGYYPYYNSNYWGAPRIKRYAGDLPPYFESWGAPRRKYRHVEWHRQHYGGHPRGDW